MKETCSKCLHVLVFKAPGEAPSYGYCDFRDTRIKFWEHCDWFEEADEFYQKEVIQILKRRSQGVMLLQD